jgi:hypothetical protein
MFKKVVSIGTIKIGGSRAMVYLRIEIRKDGELSISGVMGPLRSGNCRGSCGQIDIEFKHENVEDDDTRWGKLIEPEEINFDRGWSKELWFDLLAMWKNYHLKSNIPDEVKVFLESLPATTRKPAWV